MNLIPRFDETQPLYSAVAKGHHVLVPLGAEDTFNQDTIVLPTNDRDGQIGGLVKTGFSQEDSEKYSREAGRNVTILKKLLGFPGSTAQWIKSNNVREIIPAMLLGRWNENNKGDREIIERLSGEKFEVYLEKLSKWRDIEESPLIQIGQSWRLTSPLDAWTNMSSLLSKNEIEKLRECFLYAFEHGNPEIQSKHEKESFFFTGEKTFSSWAREGLIQSLILVALYGDNLKIPNIRSHQSWVDDLIRHLLLNADGKLWASIDQELPLIAEASPSSFIDAVKNSLSKQDKPIMQMFVEYESFMSSTSSHTGLLWALESLAWLPEYLLDASLILAKLSLFDPGGKLSNRPINSLTEIFKPWHFQTLASFSDRMNVVKEITIAQPTIGWILLRRMLPNHHAIAQPTHRMRWRMFDKNSHLDYTYKEIWDTHSYAIDLMISIFDHSEDKFSQFVEDSVNLSSNDRTRVLEFLESELINIKQSEYKAWHSIRKILSHHRSHLETNWALPEEVLSNYEKLYLQLTPVDIIQKYLWLLMKVGRNLLKDFNIGNRVEMNNKKLLKLVEMRVLSKYSTNMMLN
jgi:hypothetical protein